MSILSKYFKGFLEFPYKLSSKTASAFRLIYCLLSLLFIGLPDSAYIASLSDYFFFPPPLSLPLVSNGFPGYEAWFTIKILVYGSFWLMFIGFKTKITSLTFSIFYIIFSSYKYSLGKVDHDFHFIALPIFMAFSGWGKHFSVDSLLARRRKTYSTIPLSLYAMVLSISFLVGAIRKIEGHWLEISTQAIAIIVGKETRGVDLNIQAIPWPMFEIVDWLVVILELAFVLCYPYYKGFKRLLLFAILFHLGVLIFMGINFHQLPITYIPFFLLGAEKSIPILSRKVLAKVLLIIGFLAVIHIALFVFMEKNIFSMGLLHRATEHYQIVTSILFFLIFSLGFITIRREKLPSA